jgi:hypothetical protein
MIWSFISISHCGKCLHPRHPGTFIRKYTPKAISNTQKMKPARKTYKGLGFLSWRWTATHTISSHIHPHAHPPGTMAAEAAHFDSTTPIPKFKDLRQIFKRGPYDENGWEEAWYGRVIFPDPHRVTDLVLIGSETSLHGI